RRQALREAFRIAVELQDGFERSQRDFPDPQRALERIFLQLRDQVAPPDEDAGLRAAQQLVAAEGDQVRALRDRLLRQGLARQAEFREVDEAAAPEVDDE